MLKYDPTAMALPSIKGLMRSFHLFVCRFSSSPMHGLHPFVKPISFSDMVQLITPICQAHTFHEYLDHAMQRGSQFLFDLDLVVHMVHTSPTYASRTHAPPPLPLPCILCPFLLAQDVLSQTVCNMQSYREGGVFEHRTMSLGGPSNLHA